MLFNVGSHTGSYERKEKQRMKETRKKERQTQDNRRSRKKLFSPCPGPT
jgi:hypothetical protein